MKEISRIIEILDGDEDLLSLRLGESYAWPILRFDVIQHIINERYSLNAVGVARTEGKSRKIFNIILALWKSIPFYSNRKYTAVFFTTSLSTLKGKDGKYFNRVSEYFFGRVQNSLIVERSSDFSMKLRNHKRQISTLFFSLEARLARGPQMREIDFLVANVVEIVGRHFANEIGKVNFQNLKLKLEKSCRSAKSYKRFLLRKRPTFILIEDAHYGGELAVLTYVARNMGIKVIEPQHGFIGQTHPSYYYGLKFLENENLELYYPDYFMTYGPFWSSSIRVPSKVIDIGNPHLTETIDSISRNPVISSNKEYILVAGSGVTILETNKLLVSLIEKIGKRVEVRYRPHPTERAMVKSNYSEPLRMGVLLDTNENVYDSILMASLVIAEMSTVLFESLAFLKPTKLFDSSYTREYLTENILYVSKLDLSQPEISFETGVDHKKVADYYWMPDWKDAFDKFAQEKLL